MSNEAKLLSIITVALNEERHLTRLMNSIKSLSLPENLKIETILIDGGSTDDTVDLARTVEFDKVIELPKANIPICRNAGVREASGILLSFIDADCELSKDWLLNAMVHLDIQNPTILGWPVAPPENGTWVQQAWHMHWRFKNRATRSQEVVTNQAFRLITTRNMLLTKMAFDKLDGFDEQLATGEDTDFVFRAEMQGMDVRGVPGMLAIHHGEPATLRDFFRQQLWHANRSSYRKIANETGGRTGGNAPLFTLLYTLTLALGFASVAGSCFMKNPAWLALALPFVCLVTGPAILIGLRARSLSAIFTLPILYSLYGFARMLDLLGIGREKQSWKTVHGMHGKARKKEKEDNGR